jgi:hypothetical protein
MSHHYVLDIVQACAMSVFFVLDHDTYAEVDGKRTAAQL